MDLSLVGTHASITRVLDHILDQDGVSPSQEREHVEDIGSTVGIQSYGGGCEGVTSGECFATSRHPHLYVMAMLSGARVVRVLRMCVAAPC